MTDRIRAFRDRLAEAVAERSHRTPHGVGLFVDRAPIVYDANYVRAAGATSAAELAGEAEAAMEQFLHRRVVVEAEGAALAPGFAALGWTRSTHVVMAHTRPPDRVVDTSAVREVPLEALEAAHAEGTLADPHGDPALASQLFLVKRRVAAAVPTRFFAVVEDGRVSAHCELRSDGGVAQIEDVNTLAAHRGRGLGRLVVQHALGAALDSSEVVFLEALADDWPRELYEKLGFEVVDERHLFLRPPHPLTRIRVRTPRLELRLATVGELRTLAQVAADGIHDPDRMPFEVAWTDGADRPGFVDDFLAHHADALDAWRADDWQLALVAFHDGSPVGVQALRGREFGRSGEVDTGSWLGQAHQGHGLGTEMRSAILTLAFDGLGATRARSGAIDGNPQSLGVSRKLGYEVTGESRVSPRGADVPHTDLVLERDRFRPPVPVELHGLEGLGVLFGADS